MGGTEFASADELANALGQQNVSVMSVGQSDWDGLSPDEQFWLNDMADDIDGRKGSLSKEEKREKWLSAFVRTVSIWFEGGIAK